MRGLASSRLCHLLAVVMAQLCCIAALTGVACVIDDGIDVMRVSALRASGTNSFHKIIADWSITPAPSLNNARVSVLDNTHDCVSKLT